MRLVRIGIGSVNPTVGSVRSNVDLCVREAVAMADQGVTVGAFPEQVVGGYSPEDLVQWQGFIAAQWQQLQRFATETQTHGTVFVLGVVVSDRGHLYNCAAVVHGGRVLGLVPKEQLPTYNVFYEGRTFSRGWANVNTSVHGVPFGDLLFRFDWGALGVEVCEDAWSPDGPMRRRCYAGAEVIVNVSASPYRMGVLATRRELLATRSADNQCTLAYVNAVGANDGLIFDGGGFVFQNGRPMLSAPRWREAMATTVVDLDRTVRLRTENTTWRNDSRESSRGGTAVHWITSEAPTTDRAGLPYPVPAHGSFFLPPPDPLRTAREDFCEDLLDALALGIGDYMDKTRAFKGIGIALSGGRDSLLTTLIAWRCLQGRLAHLPADARRVRMGELLHTFYMPTRFSSEHTGRCAETISRELGASFQRVSIEEAFVRETTATETMVGGPLTPITLQNIQARLRAQRMWNWANTSGMLFLQTGNMSEKAMGYTTIGGDLEGALAVLANVPKTVVMHLLDYLLEKHGFEGIKLTLAAEPGPELAPNQRGEDELMPFRVLDACFHLYAAEKLSPGELGYALTSMFPDVSRAQLEAWSQRFVRLFVQSIYKWVQAPLSLHVGNLDLERERALQLPTVETTEWASI